MVAAETDWNTPIEFHVVVDTEVSPPCVAVWGEIDLATVVPFREALMEAVETGAREVVVDLAQVTFMGSTGIRELIRVHRDLDRITLRSPTSIVQRALQTAALPEMFVVE